MPLRRILLILPIAIVVIGAMVAIALYVPLPLNPYLDFQVLYRANQGILQGIPLYDRVGQAQMVAENLNVPVDKVFVLPFPYPPWYALVTLPIAYLPIDIAVRVWFLLNVSMLMVAVWLMTDGWEPWKRLCSFIAAMLFLPVIGALIVGQYVFPAILGMSLIIYALKHQRIGLTAVGMALVTFKPHIGIFVLLAVLADLFLRRDEFGRRAFWATTFAGVILFIIGFIADRAWPVRYFQSLFSFKDVSECEICVSMPLTIARMIGLGFDQSAPVAGILLVVLVALFIGRRYRLGDEVSVAFFVCVALLVNPYMFNYDFAFAIIPLFYLASSTNSKMNWLWIALIFFLPWIGLGLFERAGNFTLLVSVLAMMFIILTRFYKEHKITS